jgi:hypothetical protein
LKCHSDKTNNIISRENLPIIVRYIKQLLDTIKGVADRQVGDGFNIVKFHLIIHMFEDDIPRYGAPANVSGGPGEAQFKDNFKKQGSTTQKNDTTFVEQVCVRKFQHHTADRCAHRVCRMEAGGSALYGSKPYDVNLLHEGTFVPEATTPAHFGSVLRETNIYLLRGIPSNCKEPETDESIPGLTCGHYRFF